MPVSDPEPRVWHNNLRFKSNLGYISDPSTRARPPTSSGRSVLSLSSPSLSFSFSEWNAKGEGENPRDRYSVIDFHIYMYCIFAHEYEHETRTTFYDR